MNKTEQPTTFPPKAAALLRAYGACGTITGAAKAAGTAARNHYHWLDHVKGYKEAFQEAQRTFGETLEAEAFRRATKGVQRVKFYKGMPIMVPLLDGKGRPVLDDDGKPILTVYTEHEFSDTLLIFVMKHRLADQYGDKLQIDHNSDRRPRLSLEMLMKPPDGPDPIEERLRDEERRPETLEELRERTARPKPYEIELARLNERTKPNGHHGDN